MLNLQEIKRLEAMELMLLKGKSFLQDAAKNEQEVGKRLLEAKICNPLPTELEIPYQFKTLERSVFGGAWKCNRGKDTGLLVLASIVIREGLGWYHVSLSRRDRLPAYREMSLVKKHWIGDNRWAIHVFPEAHNHVNIHETCLHLWHCLEPGFKLPDFRIEGQI